MARAGVSGPAPQAGVDPASAPGAAAAQTVADESQGAQAGLVRPDGAQVGDSARGGASAAEAAGMDAVASRVAGLEAEVASLRAALTALADAVERAEAAGRRETELRDELVAKEAVIRELDRALRTVRWLDPIMRVHHSWVSVCTAVARVCRPRLGRLHHHPPVPARLPRVVSLRTRADAMPSISLVVPSYQQGVYIERTLRSILDQEYPRLDLRVQDGGSTDGTVAILKRYQDRVAAWDSRPDAGQAEAINLGFARSSGEIMAWLNSDDLLLPGALACVGDYFARHPKVDVVYGDRILVNEEGLEIGRWILPAHDDAVLSWADYVPQETLFWRRTLWERVGGCVDTSFAFALDWELLIRFRAAGARMQHLPRLLGAFRVHPEQKTVAAIDTVGFAEMDRIRFQTLGFVPTRVQVHRATGGYLRRHMVAHLADTLRRRWGSRP